MTPVCPTHNKEMRQNSRGWYCATVTGFRSDGTKEYCKFQPGAPTPIRAPTSAPAAPKGTDIERLFIDATPSVALNASVRLHGGIGSPAIILADAEVFLDWLRQKEKR